MNIEKLGSYICALVDCGVVSFDYGVGYPHNGKVFRVFEMSDEDGVIGTDDKIITQICRVHYNKGEDIIEVYGVVNFGEFCIDTMGYVFL